jgi:hypothetical protein
MWIEDSRRALAQAIKCCESQARFLRLLNAEVPTRPKPVKSGHVWAWLNKPGLLIPAELVIPIERIVNAQVSRHALRPDLYPREVN